MRRTTRFCLPDAGDGLVLSHAGSLPRVSKLLDPEAAQHVSAADASALQHDLRRLSRPSRLDASRASMLAAAHEFGVGATVHSLALATLDSLGRNQTLFAPKLVLWADREECAQADLSCFFTSLPSLDETSPPRQAPESADGATQVASRRLAASRKKGHGHKASATGAAHPRIAIDGLSQSQWRRFIDAWYGPGSAHAVPAEQPAAMASLEKLAAAMRPRMKTSRHRGATECRRTGGGCPRVLPAHFAATADEAAVLARLPHRYTRHGRFWLLAQTLHFLTRPNAALRHQLQRERAALRMRAHHPVLALHVRKGDACTHRGECRGLEAFMPEVRRAAKAYGIRAVFLATPSAEGRAETARYPEFTWLYRNVTDAAAASKVKRLEDGLLNRRVRAVDEWRSLMIDVYLMAEAQALIGAFSSSAARLALALMAASPDGCLKPFVSVDINWCFAFFRGGDSIIRRGAEQYDGPRRGITAATAGGSRFEREARGAAAAKRVLQSGMTC